MRRKIMAALAAATLAGTALAGSAAAGTTNDSAAAHRGGTIRLVGLTDHNKLVSFWSHNPRSARTVGTVTGLQGDSWLIGIDLRAANGKVYGVGDQGGIYTLDVRRAEATKVSQLTVPLSGTSFGVDFNPAANRLRVVSDTGQNLRHNIDDPAGAPAAGVTVADSTLTVPPATTPAAGVTAVAYTNDDKDPATATTLFDLNVATDQIQVQSPANAGLLAPTGSLGVDAKGDAGFDIRANRGIATLKVDGRYRLYDVDLLSGDADRVGEFPRGLDVVDLTGAR